jgi:hypothetical protein
MRTGNSYWLAELVKFIKGKMDEVNTAIRGQIDGIYDEISDLEQEIQHKAPEDHTHPEYVKQVVETMPNATNYTVDGTASLFYNVTVFLGGVLVATATVDISLLRNSDQGYDFRVASVGEDFVYVTAKLNSNGSVTFTAGSTDSTMSPRIAHIAGF